MYQWADENTENIKFLYVSTEDIATHTSIIQNRLTIGGTIDGTRSYHCFGLNSQTKLELYTLSTDEIFVVKGLVVDIECLKIGHYVTAVYECQWYPSLILEISGYDKKCFFWPPMMIYIMCHSPTLLDLLKCQILLEVMDNYKNSYKISAKLFEIFNQNLSKLQNRKQ